jgi:16S rRNA (adenine1518-N6/adenine1519-N6)-dimethyltransferase
MNRAVNHRIPRARKRFGQHFLKDARIIEQIVQWVQPDDNELVLEVGPGRGALTRSLCRNLDRLVAVEIDRDLVAALGQDLSGQGLHLIEGDVLDLDLGQLLESEGKAKVFIIGNLPYNITAPLLFRLLKEADRIGRAIVMVQREVARRLVARPGNKDYGLLAVLLGMRAIIESRLEVQNTAFTPVPKVHSTVVELRFREQPLYPVLDESCFNRLVRMAFSQRRKMMHNSLAGWWPDEHGQERLVAAATTAGIDLRRRPETLSIEEFGAFSDACTTLSANTSTQEHR